MNNSRLIIFILVTLMLFVVACAPSQPATPEQMIEKIIEKPSPVEEKPTTQQTTQTTQPSEPISTEQKPTSKTVAVSLKGFKFVPADVTVKVGDTIVWTNEDTAPHTVESSDGVLRSDELSKGDTYSYTFTKPGKHEYICGIHPYIHGSVTVQ